MKAIARHDLESGIDTMIKGTLDMLEDLHIVHHKTDIEKLLDLKIPGSQTTVAKLVNNLFQMINERHIQHYLWF